MDNQNPNEPVLLDKPSRFENFWLKLKSFKNLSWPKKLLVILPIVLIAAIGVWLSRPGATATTISPSTVTPAPTTVASPLTGVKVPIALAKRPVTAIMIENSTDARPQSGLQSAGVVFEAVAEGGITRFVTLFQEATPSYIGPVRSVRPYFLDWVYPFNASVAHVGGSPQGLKEVRGGMRDIDEFFNPGAYWRISSRPA